MLRYGVQEASRFIIETNLLNSTSNEFKGIIEGLAVVYDKPDKEGNIIKKGAFDNQDFRNIKVPMKWEHLYGLNTGWTIEKTDKGLYVKGQIPKEFLNKTFIQQYLRDAQASQNKIGGYFGAGLSGEMHMDDYDINPDTGGSVVRKARLIDVSLVIEPKNPHSMITLAQSASTPISEENKPIILKYSLEDSNMIEDMQDEVKALTGSRYVEANLKLLGAKPDLAKAIISKLKTELREEMILQQGVPQNKERDVSFTCNECEARKLQSQKGENQKSENQAKFKIIKTKQ